MRAPPYRQRGVALLAAVLVVALVTLLVAGLLDRGLLGQMRALQHSRAAQAVALQQGLELWAARILRDDAARDGVDAAGDAWSHPMPPLPLPEGMAQGRMRELDGCLNLNGLWSRGQQADLAVARFERLLRVLELDPRLVDAVLDWLDEDDQGRAGGGEEATYAALTPPRRPANGPFVHASELALVAGIDAAILQRLAPHVCAHSDPDSPVNVNTASVAVLMSLHEDIGPGVARRLHQDGRARHASSTDFLAAVERELGRPPSPQLALGIDVRSRHFLAEIQIVQAQVPVRLYSLLEREAGTGLVRVTARSQGRW
ncbi:MAG: type II secretion system minor pseudopilin GspK [Xanthomonadales bacterium]|nr:type II secretion system minor pseudopilin GspK [Xanthomonadales bacterium]